jgi:hypothetical protein
MAYIHQRIIRDIKVFDVETNLEIRSYEETPKDSPLIIRKTV